MIPEGKYKVKDEALFAEVQKLKDGTSGDYNLLYELSEKYIYKIINDIVKNHHTTEDLMQETYLQIYNKIDTLQEAKTFYVWAGRIATNLTLRYVQKYRKETLAVADEEGSTDFVFDVATDDNECFIPENVLMDKEKQRLIAEIIDSLSIEQKLSVQYFYYEEMSVRDIAQVMGCSEGTVKSRLNYARKSIKDAVIDLDEKQGTRLYSLGTLPLFWLVFREGVEALVLAGATAAVGVAGSVAGVVDGASSVGTAGAVAGSVGSAGTGMAGTVAGGAGSVGTGGGIAGTVAGVGNAGATAGTVASTGATAGSAASTGAATGATKAATGLGAKFFGTAAGKAVAGIVAAAVVVGGGAAISNQMKEPDADVTQEPVVTQEPAEQQSEGQITFYYRGDPEKENIWEDHREDILFVLKDKEGNNIISEGMDVSSPEMQDLYAIMQASTSLEDAKLIFEEYQQEAADIESKDDYWYLRVTDDLDIPDTLEFTFDGIDITFDIRVVNAEIGFHGYYGKFFEDMVAYSAGYTEGEGEDISYHYASSVGYYIHGTYTYEGDITQSKFARNKNGNYINGNQEDMPIIESSNEPVSTTGGSGEIFFDYCVDFLQEEIWGDYYKSISMFYENYCFDKTYQLTSENEWTDQWGREEPDEMDEVINIVNLIQESVTLSEAQAFFSENQETSMLNYKNGNSFSVDVTDEFPETMLFDYLGSTISFDVESVEATIHTSDVYGLGDTPTYTAGYYEDNDTSHCILAMGVKYTIRGNYVILE